MHRYITKYIKIFLSVNIFVASAYIGHSQTLLQQINTLEAQYTFYTFQQKDSISLTRMGSLEREFPRAIFRRAEINSQTRQIILEGFINMTGNPQDTKDGLGGFDLLVAKKLKDDKLTNIRRFGTTMSTSANDSISKQEGYFALKFQMKRDDVLVIGNPGTLFWGAVVVPIGKLLPE